MSLCWLLEPCATFRGLPIQSSWMPGTGTDETCESLWSTETSIPKPVSFKGNHATRGSGECTHQSFSSLSFVSSLSMKLGSRKSQWQRPAVAVQQLAKPGSQWQLLATVNFQWCPALVQCARSQKAMLIVQNSTLDVVVVVVVVAVVVVVVVAPVLSCCPRCYRTIDWVLDFRLRMSLHNKRVCTVIHPEVVHGHNPSVHHSEAKLSICQPCVCLNYYLVTANLQQHHTTSLIQSPNLTSEPLEPLGTLQKWVLSHGPGRSW